MSVINPNKPAGLVPVASLIASMGGFNGGGRVYAIPPADTSGYWPGDVVIPATAAGNTYGIGGDPNTGFQCIAKYVEASTHPVIGVVQAVGIDPSGGQWINPNQLGSAASNYPYGSPGGTYRPAAAQSIWYYALVIDDPWALYEVQEGGSGTQLTQTSVGNNIDLLVANPATVGVTGQSGTQLDNASVNTTATLPCRIMQLVQRPDNGLTATVPGYQKWIVKLNNHYFLTGIAAA